MNYFNLRIHSCDRDVHYESDVEPKFFETFAAVLGNELINHRVFNKDERIVMRMVPRWTGEPRPEETGFIDARSLPELTRFSVDIVFEEEPRPDPVAYFTLRWHSLDRFLIYQLDMGVAAVFESLLKAAVTRMIDRQQLAVSEKFKFEVRAFNEGLPTIDPELFEKTAKARVSGPLPPLVEKPPERTRKDVTISITSRKPLITPVLKDPSTYPEVEPVRRVKPGLLRVYMERSASLRLKDAVQVSEEQRVEVAGALVGGVFVDEEGEVFVEVSDILPAPEAQGDFSSVRIDTEAWRGLIERVNLHYADRQKVLVGWYHTHLISKLSVTASAAAGGALTATQQTFMSADDVFVHNHFFPQPWHVALVVDLSARQDVFFCRHGQQLVDCGGFLLFGSAEQR